MRILNQRDLYRFRPRGQKAAFAQLHCKIGPDRRHYSEVHFAPKTSWTGCRRAVETFRSTINAVNPAVPVTLRQLVKHYEENELPSKAFSTQRTFQTSLKAWVLPKWGEHRLSDVRTVEVEGWLHSLPLANATKAKTFTRWKDLRHYIRVADHPTRTLVLLTARD